MEYVIIMLENQTTLEEDEKLLSDYYIEGAKFYENDKQEVCEKTGKCLSWNQYHAILYRSEMKKIMRAQLEFVRYLMALVNSSSEITTMITEGIELPICKEAYKAMYMTHLQSEEKILDDFDEFEKEEDEYWY